jgi:hypothetical protein
VEEFAIRWPTLRSFAPLHSEVGQLFIHGLIAAAGSVYVIVFDNLVNLIPRDQIGVLSCLCVRPRQQPYFVPYDWTELTDSQVIVFIE